MIYAISDIHGQYNLFKKSVEFLTKPEDKLIILGDVIDRGTEGFKILLEIAENKNKFEFILGNHEDMLKKVLDNEDDEKIKQIYFGNGGYSTYKAYKKASWYEQQKVNDLLMSSPLGLGIKNESGVQFFLSHSGRYSNFIPPIKPREMLWNRDYSYEEIPTNVMVVHGHTPISEIRDVNIDTMGVYNKGRKICLDNGYNSGRLHMLCLGTLEIIQIKEENHA